MEEAGWEVCLGRGDDDNHGGGGRRQREGQGGSSCKQGLASHRPRPRQDHSSLHQGSGRSGRLRDWRARATKVEEAL